jgi:hypothetical protein
MAPKASPRRMSYLLRIWRAGNGDAPQWRLSLEDTQTHTLQGFEDLAGLMAFLEAQLGPYARTPDSSEQNDELSAS